MKDVANNKPMPLNAYMPDMPIISPRKIKTQHQVTPVIINKVSLINKKLSAAIRREGAHLTSLYRMEQKAFRYVEPLRRGSRL